MKKLVALVITLSLVLSLSLTHAFAENGVTLVIPQDAYIREEILDNKSVVYLDKYVIFEVMLKDGRIMIEYNDVYTEAIHSFLAPEDCFIYVSVGDLVDAFNNANHVTNLIENYFSAFRFEIGDTIGE